MSQSRWIRHHALRALVLALGLVLALTSCSLWRQDDPAAADPAVSPTAPANATAEAAPPVEVEFPSREDLEVSIEPIELDQQMTEVLPAGANIHDVVDITLPQDPFPETGATVTFDVGAPLAEEATVAVVHWNEELEEWEPLPSELSADGRKLSANVEHFSKYSWIDYTFNLLNQVTGNYAARGPECDGQEPVWSEAMFTDDINGPLLWCLGTDGQNSDRLQVRVVNNRPSAMLIATAITPKRAESDVLGDTGPESWAAVALGGNLLPAGMTQQYLLPPGGEYLFSFDKEELFEFWRSGKDDVLINAEASAGTIVGGMAYNAIAEKAGGSGMVAAVTTIASMAECLHTVTNAARAQTTAAALGAFTSCLQARAGDIARRVKEGARQKAEVSWKRADLDSAPKVKGIIFASRLYMLAKGQLALSSIIGDSKLPPSSFQLTFTPSLVAIPEAVGRDRQGGTLADLCGTGCTPSGEATIDHPTWGEVRIVTLLPEETNSGPGYIAAVDDKDQVLWSAQTDRMYELAPAATAQDSTGNVFLNFNPGRHNGVIVLKPTQHGFDDLGTLPSDTYQKRFYHAAAVGEPAGEVVIWHFRTSCDPSCAEGATTKEQFRWNGSDYVSAGPPEEVTTWPDEHYATVL